MSRVFCDMPVDHAPRGRSGWNLKGKVEPVPLDSLAPDRLCATLCR